LESIFFKLISIEMEHDMSGVELISGLIGVSAFKLSHAERVILEAELLLQICSELKEIFREEHRDYFNFMKFDRVTENKMLEANFTRLVIKDILQSEEYTVEGLARYIDFPEDVIHEVMCGINTNPSAQLLQKAIDLHRLVRRDLYQAIFKKVIALSDVEK
jgi:hypothetical protein